MILNTRGKIVWLVIVCVCGVVLDFVVYEVCSWKTEMKTLDEHTMTIMAIEVVFYAKRDMNLNNIWIEESRQK